MLREPHETFAPSHSFTEGKLSPAETKGLTQAHPLVGDGALNPDSSSVLSLLLYRLDVAGFYLFFLQDGAVFKLHVFLFPTGKPKSENITRYSKQKNG